MPDYKKMYFQLFNCVSQALELLQEGQQKTEESYVLDLPSPDTENDPDETGAGHPAP